MMKILCFGSLNVDYTYCVDHFTQKGETLSSDSMQIFGGGKGLNQSVALARAGAPVYHAGAIGEDGVFLLEILGQAGVNTDLIRINPQVRTGHAIIQNDRMGDNCILLYGGANQTISRAYIDEVLGYFTDGDYLLLQNEINELSYLIDRAYEMGMKIVLNPSPMDEKVLKLPLDKIAVYILNEVEAVQLLKEAVPAAADNHEPAVQIRKKYPDAVIVLTLGSNGSVYIDDMQTVIQTAYPAKAVDTTAAGDTFTGYLIAGMIRGEDPKEVMDEASRAASIAVTRSGAAPSIPARKEVNGG